LVGENCAKNKKMPKKVEGRKFGVAAKKKGKNNVGGSKISIQDDSKQTTI